MLLTKTLFGCVRAGVYVECMDVAPLQTPGNKIEADPTQSEDIMKIWNKPQVREQAVGMEVTAYLPADIDLI